MLTPKQTIAGYTVVDRLGSGGMGEVYRAIHGSLGRVVAIKVLRRDAVAPNSLARFHAEARIQSRIAHPNIATLFEFLEFERCPCIVMEFVDGQTLADCISASGRIPVAEALRLWKKAVEAVGYLHENGIIHRDIKTSNIKISSRGELKLLDFGIARAHTDARLTEFNRVVGTPAISAPEQITSGQTDARSDIWALGVLLYEMLAGRNPFPAGQAGDPSHAILHKDPQSLEDLQPPVPKSVRTILFRCLQKKPEQRFQTASDILRELGSVSLGHQTPSQTRSPFSLHAMLAVLAALVGLAVVGVMGARFTHRSSTQVAEAISPQLNTDAATLLHTSPEVTAEVLEEAEAGHIFLGKTPFVYRRPRGERHKLLFYFAGYRKQEINLGDDELERTVSLEKDSQ